MALNIGVTAGVTRTGFPPLTWEIYDPMESVGTMCWDVRSTGSHNTSASRFWELRILNSAHFLTFCCKAAAISPTKWYNEWATSWPLILQHKVSYLWCSGYRFTKNMNLFFGRVVMVLGRDALVLCTKLYSIHRETKFFSEVSTPSYLRIRRHVCASEWMWRRILFNLQAAVT